MICFIVFAALACAAGATPPATAADLMAVGVWVLCDIELLKLIFGRRCDMGKHYISKEACCPFYRCEDAQAIYCEGVEPGTTLRLTFAGSAIEYKHIYCRDIHNYADCRIARMLAGKWA